MELIDRGQLKIKNASCKRIYPTATVIIMQLENYDPVENTGWRNCQFMKVKFELNSTRLLTILGLLFRESLIYIDNCPTSCNTKQSIYYSSSSLYMFRVSTIPIIRRTRNCNYSLRYCAATFLQRGQANLATSEGGSCTKK